MDLSVVWCWRISEISTGDVHQLYFVLPANIYLMHNTPYSSYTPLSQHQKEDDLVARSKLLGLCF